MIEGIFDIFFIAFAGCESHMPQGPQLLSRFTPEERKIQSCFDRVDRMCKSANCQSLKVRECLPGTSYASSSRSSGLKGRINEAKSSY